MVFEFLKREETGLQIVAFTLLKLLRGNKTYNFVVFVKQNVENEDVKLYFNTNRFCMNPVVFLYSKYNVYFRWISRSYIKKNP